MFLRTLICLALLTGPAFAQARGQHIDPAHIDRIGFLIGDFEIATEESNPQGEWRQRPTYRAETIRDLHGAILVEDRRYETVEEGISTITVMGYDPMREEYRFVISGSFLGLVDVFEGSFEGDRLVVDNVSSGTSYEAPDGTVYNYQLWFEDTPGPGHARGINISWDGGENYYPWVRGTAMPVTD